MCLEQFVRLRRWIGRPNPLHFMWHLCFPTGWFFLCSEPLEVEFLFIFTPQFAHSCSLNFFVPGKWKLIFNLGVLIHLLDLASKWFFLDSMHLRSPSPDIPSIGLSSVWGQRALSCSVSQFTLLSPESSPLLSPASLCSLGNVSLFKAHLTLAIYLSTICEGSISEAEKHLGLGLTKKILCWW